MSVKNAFIPLPTIANQESYSSKDLTESYCILPSNLEDSMIGLDLEEENRRLKIYVKALESRVKDLESSQIENSSLKQSILKLNRAFYQSGA